MTRLTAKDALTLALAGQPRRLKMGNKPVWECQYCLAYVEFISQAECKCNKPDWQHFASKREWKRWHELKTLEKAGRIRNLRRQVSYRLEVNSKLICRYIADAVYEECERWIKGEDIAWQAYIWQLVVEDSKGHATAVYKLKRELMAAGACPEFPEGVEIRET